MSKSILLALSNKPCSPEQISDCYRGLAKAYGSIGRVSLSENFLMPREEIENYNKSENKIESLKKKSPRTKARNKDKLTLNREFVAAVRRLRQDFSHEGGWNEAAKVLFPLIERNTIRRLFQYDLPDENSPLGDTIPKEFAKISTIQKQRLVWYYSDGPERFVYRRVAQTIRQERNWQDIIIDRLQGTYRYFRYFAPTNDPGIIEFVNGKIEVFSHENMPKFNHWSHTTENVQLNPEHIGPIFRGGEHYFFVGTSNGVLRLAICDHSEKIPGVLIGLVLSLRSGWPHDPYAARFVMVNIKNKTLIKELSDVSPDPNREGNPGKTLGERKFFEITKGEYAYYMLSKHAER